MKISSSSILRRRISIKDLSSTQKTGLCLLAGLLGLAIVSESPQYGQHPQRYQLPLRDPPIVGYTVILEANLSNKDYSKQYSELISLLLTMQSLNSAGWHVVDVTLES